jgi:hypothetical protein
MFGKGWITATRQRWKLVVLYVLTLVGLFSAVGGLVPSVGQLVTRDRDLFLLMCGIYGAIWVGWIALAMRCPICTRRTGWWYLRNAGVTEWFTAFVSARQCPVCGYDGETRPHSSP